MAEQVLESFRGYVDKVEGGVARVHLESQSNGDILYGHKPAAELAALGIGEQDSFSLLVVKESGETTVRIEYVAPNPVSDEEAREIAEELRAVFGESTEVEF